MNNNNNYDITINNLQYLSDKQKLFLEALFNLLIPFEIFYELSVLKVSRDENEKWKIYAKPMVIFEDMLQDIIYKENAIIGIFMELPEDNLLLNEEHIYQCALEYAKSILWEYIWGKRKPIEILN
ncbi:MAG: hypothetical protein QHH13_05115 [Melioribacter sp.]|uniref:hypothetical protein n=1 Tax=Rosettibacter primus TaxID=3111523 RepID=UPI00247BC04E|nr:hypothetical protein [Melioribacter sp.]